MDMQRKACHDKDSILMEVPIITHDESKVDVLEITLLKSCLIFMDS